MSSAVSDLILSLTPEDGSSIGKGAMMALLKDHLPQLSEDAYAQPRDALIDDGVLGRGKRLVGSVCRVDVTKLELSASPDPLTKAAAKIAHKRGAERSVEPTEVVC